MKKIVTLQIVIFFDGTLDGIIEHEGVVERIDGAVVFVRIEQRSACAACRAKSLCTTADMTEKIIEADLRPEQTVAVGDRVTVVGSRSVGFKAVFWAFVVPVVLIFATLFVARHFTSNEAISGTAALAVLLPYCGVLFALRKKMAAKFRFAVK